MTSRRPLATIALGAALLLGACGTDDEPKASPSSSGSSSASATPSTDASDSTAAPKPPADADDLVGTWENTAGDWTVRFADDGTFTEDYQGVPNFRTGTYTFEGDTVALEGGDGNTDEGTVDGSTLVFKLGTLERQE